MIVNPTRNVVLGLGSANGDDQFGWAVIDELVRRQVHAELRKIANPVDIVSWLSSERQVHLVDAAVGLPDDIYVEQLEFAQSKDRRQMKCLPSGGTHDIGVYATLMMARALELPVDQVTLWLGRAEHFEPMSSMSRTTESAMHECLERLSKKLNDAKVIAPRLDAD